MEIFPRSDNGGLRVGKGSIEVVQTFDQGKIIPVVLLVHQLGCITGSSFLGLSKAELDGRKGDLRNFVLENGRHLSPKVGHVLHVGGPGTVWRQWGRWGAVPQSVRGSGLKSLE